MPGMLGEQTNKLKLDGTEVQNLLLTKPRGSFKCEEVKVPPGTKAMGPRAGKSVESEEV